MIYAAGLVAHKDFKYIAGDYWTQTVTLSFGHIVTYFSAVSEDEANGKAARLCKETFPEKDGWIKHSYTIIKVKL